MVTTPTIHNPRRRKFMRTKYHQMTLKDTFSDCQDMFMDDAHSLPVSSHLPI